MLPYREDRRADFYRAALTYAQSLWQEGKPAQAILQINKALSADLEESPELFAALPSPYAALVWIIRQAPEGTFLGNPVRHFQHLATRMSGPRCEVRSWRAWACFHLSERCLNAVKFPRDEHQLGQGKVRIPAMEEVGERMQALAWPGEWEAVSRVLATFQSSRG
ncbi:MAG: hypothetical protein ACQKBU_01020 [Verrucomicrobiales bacterium]